MKLRDSYSLILLLVLAIGITLTLLLLQPPPEAAVGADHESYASMKQGGDYDRHAGKFGLGWIYGALQIALFVCCMLACVRTGRGWIIFCGFLYLVVFTTLMLTYGSREKDHLLLGLPKASAWLIYGMWPISAIFAILYVWKFPTWIYSRDDAARFDDLKKQFKQTSHADGPE